LSSAFKIDRNQSTRITAIGGRVADISVEVGIPSAKADGVVLSPAPDGGVVVAGSVVLQVHDSGGTSSLGDGGIGLATGIAEAVGGAAGGRLAETVVADRAGDRPRVADQVSHRVLAIGEIPRGHPRRVGPGEEFIDRGPVQVAGLQGSRAVEVGVGVLAIVNGLALYGRVGTGSIGIDVGADASIQRVVGVGGLVVDRTPRGLDGDAGEPLAVVVGIRGDIAAGGIGLGRSIAHRSDDSAERIDLQAAVAALDHPDIVDRGII
jgi:hypothetical protein